jgi:tRNA dimethylallyltransferase
MHIVSALTISTSSFMILSRGAVRTATTAQFGQRKEKKHFTSWWYNKFIQTPIQFPSLGTAIPFYTTMTDFVPKNKRKLCTKEGKADDGNRKPTQHNHVSSNSTPDESLKSANAKVKPIVIVISGPTGSGKSDVAAYLCSTKHASHILHNLFASHYNSVTSENDNCHLCWNVADVNCEGHIISADSVQAYKGVNVGANKPTLDERRITPYHLIDIVDSTDQYNAAEWTDDAISVIDDLSENTRKILHAYEYSKEHNSRVITFPQNFTLPVVVGGTMMYVQWLVNGRPDAPKPSPEVEQRASEIIGEYQAMGDDMGWIEALKVVSTYGETFQKRTEKLCGRDWYRLRRLMEVALAVQDCSTNIYTGERMGGLSALGYDVRYFFLCPNDRMKHAHILDERCEQMIARGLLEETLDLALSGNLPHGSQASRSIGYRQVLSYLRRSNPKANDVTTFENFLDEFTAATRQYSKKQMQWFRRDKECIFIPVDLSSDITKDQRIEEAAKMIMNFCIISREDYEMELTRGEFSLSEKTKKVNEEQAKGMRVFLGKRNIYKQGSDELKKILQVADTCTSKINSSNGDFSFP